MKIFSLVPAAVLLLTSVSLSHAADLRQQAAAGAALYVHNDCGHCHGTDLKGAAKGPAIDRIAHDKHWTAARITAQLLDGGQKMPPFRDAMSDDEIAQLVSFLRAKKRPALP